IYAYPDSSYNNIPDAIKSMAVLDAPIATLNHTDTNTYGRLNFSYSPPFFTAENRPKIYASTAVPDKAKPQYIITAIYDLERLLTNIVPVEVSLYTKVWLQGKNGHVLASTNSEGSNLSHLPPSSINTTRFGDAVSIYAQSTQLHRTSQGSVLFWFTVGLSLFTCTLIIMNWRHIHLLVHAQKATQRESNFRRAIEDSITTGLQGFDLNLQINYVNPAFCAMVGYKETELIGLKAPFPYWPENLVQTFLGTIKNLERKTHTGIEAQLQKRNGELIHVMLYISPLIDEVGEQNGWITAINDISESKRSREELALAGQRFTTVLEGMDAAISVTAIGSSTLLFTNNAYRTLFGNSEETHALLIQELKRVQPTPIDTIDTIDTDSHAYTSSIDSKESSHLKETALLKFYFEAQDRWVEVRSQFLPWVDGRLAQMLVTTDITERHKAEEQAAIQAEQTEAASRLITMGEMASSVAHELNQPLTAIHNYCSGLIHRVQNNTLSREELLQALEKTAKQADRAGKITQRIRSFVKKHTPNRVLTPVNEVIENTYDFIEMDARRRSIKVDIHIENNLPPIYIDPILVEQVLLNLTRNAAESISEAHRPPNQRYIKIEIKRILDEEGIEKLEFSVLDSGCGMPKEVIEHMFDAFFTTKANGLGIGLNLCRSIIESHGGHLYFHNTYNQDILTGCCFAFSLPIHVEETKDNAAITKEKNGDL
ncbi:MAG: PAS domain-containing sensor histidine kinase, partial [Saezia sp.]